jgi:hypothetical protein
MEESKCVHILKCFISIVDAQSFMSDHDKSELIGTISNSFFTSETCGVTSKNFMEEKYRSREEIKEQYKLCIDKLQEMSEY